MRPYTIKWLKADGSEGQHHYVDPSRTDAIATAEAAIEAGPDFVEAWVEDRDGRRIFTRKKSDVKRGD